MNNIKRVALVLCQSGRFETGEGTCALICLGQLGSPRTSGCHCVENVHGKLARQILEELKVNP